MPVGQQIDTALMNEVRETVKLIKMETNSLLQKTVGIQFPSLLLFSSDILVQSCCLSIHHRWK